MEHNHRYTVDIGGFGLGTILTIVFLILKLCGVITWKWVFVFLPLIISVSLTVLIILVVFIIAVIGIKKDWWD